jgi:uncharacterized protein YdeI (YjbR/CyaY-like superfamily)
MNPIFFKNQSDLRKWFEKNHNVKSELLIGFFKSKSCKTGITWSQSVDEALCFGWIDGIRKSIDIESYNIRFTPRKPGSIWSAVNINKVEKLTRLGLMQPAGISAYNKREKNKSKIYSYEKEPVVLDKEYKKKFKANKKAWKYFNLQPPSYQKPAINWVMSAKQRETCVRRLNILIKDSEAGEKIKLLSYGLKK